MGVDLTMATVEYHHGAYLITGRGWGGERGTLVQTDYDYPATAVALGFDLRRVQRRFGITATLSRVYEHGCDHSGTDGTIDCRDCGVKASAFIGAAAEHLDSLC